MQRRAQISSQHEVFLSVPPLSLVMVLKGEQKQDPNSILQVRELRRRERRND